MLAARPDATTAPKVQTSTVNSKPEREARSNDCSAALAVRRKDAVRHHLSCHKRFFGGRLGMLPTSLAAILVIQIVVGSIEYVQPLKAAAAAAAR
jgi:hypothetical protein